MYYLNKILNFCSGVWCSLGNFKGFNIHMQYKFNHWLLIVSHLISSCIQLALYPVIWHKNNSLTSGMVCYSWLQFYNNHFLDWTVSLACVMGQVKQGQEGFWSNTIWIMPQWSLVGQVNHFHFEPFFHFLSRFGFVIGIANGPWFLCGKKRQKTKCITPLNDVPIYKFSIVSDLMCMKFNNDFAHRLIKSRVHSSLPVTLVCLQ